MDPSAFPFFPRGSLPAVPCFPSLEKSGLILFLILRLPPFSSFLPFLGLDPGNAPRVVEPLLIQVL